MVAVTAAMVVEEMVAVNSDLPSCMHVFMDDAIGQEANIHAVSQPITVAMNARTYV